MAPGVLAAVENIGESGVVFHEKQTVEETVAEVPTPLISENDLEHPKPGSRYLVISPYTDAAHLVDTSKIDIQDRLFAESLAILVNIRPDYATAPYIDTFNWPDVFAELKRLAKLEGHIWTEQKFFAVAFRSQIPPTTDYSHLGVLDKAAHAEAVASGGFLKYWFGYPDAEGRNLATCLWKSPADAHAGGTGPAHRRAAAATRANYTFWHIDRLAITIDDDLTDWHITEWSH